MQNRAYRHGCGIRTAAAERGYVLVSVYALKTRRNYYAPLIKLAAYALGGHAHDARGTIRGVGLQPDLPAGQGHHRQSHGLQSHGHECNRLLLACGQKHIHLPFRRIGVELMRPFNQFICRITLS